jgi:hypothetical protein
LTLIETTGTVSASELFSSDVLDVDTLAFFTGQVTMVTASNFIVGGA